MDINSLKRLVSDGVGREAEITDSIRSCETAEIDETSFAIKINGKEFIVSLKEADTEGEIEYNAIVKNDWRKELHPGDAVFLDGASKVIVEIEWLTNNGDNNDIVRILDMHGNKHEVPAYKLR